jgi:hypothetical protein
MKGKQEQARTEQDAQPKDGGSEWNDLVAAVEAELEQWWASVNIHAGREEQNEAL